MKDVGPPESFFLSSAEGWLELGLCEDGLVELGRVTAAVRRRPEALELQWRLESGLGRWKESRRTARQMVRLSPRKVGGWILLAFAARRDPDRGLATAKRVLLKALPRFPREPLVPYNLACYDCQLGLRAECLRWLASAFERAAKKDGWANLLGMAVSDPDLEAVRPQVLEAARAHLD